jgi:cytochrome c551/c552
MSYDPACENLARHFLDDLHASEKLIKELAQCIQDEIDDWIMAERVRLEAENVAAHTG